MSNPFQTSENFRLSAATNIKVPFTTAAAHGAKIPLTWPARCWATVTSDQDCRVAVGAGVLSTAAGASTSRPIGEGMTTPYVLVKQGDMVSAIGKSVAGTVTVCGDQPC